MRTGTVSMNGSLRTPPGISAWRGSEGTIPFVPIPISTHLERPMFDELDRLRKCPNLFGLLTHYANLGEPNREAWQPRLMEMDGVEPGGLSKSHGELLAFGWVEQNTGQVPICYRITLAGIKALRQAHATKDEEDDLSVSETTPFGKRHESLGSAHDADVSEWLC
jgi:hypothetical protein